MTYNSLVELFKKIFLQVFYVQYVKQATYNTPCLKKVAHYI